MTSTLLGPCRWCTRPVYGTTGDPVEHPCCTREAETRPALPCSACQASADAARRRGEDPGRDPRAADPTMQGSPP